MKKWKKQQKSWEERVDEEQYSNHGQRNQKQLIFFTRLEQKIFFRFGKTFISWFAYFV